MTQHLCSPPQAALICHHSAAALLCFGTNKCTDKSWLCHHRQWQPFKRWPAQHLQLEQRRKQRTSYTMKLWDRNDELTGKHRHCNTLGLTHAKNWWATHQPFYFSTTSVLICPSSPESCSKGSPMLGITSSSCRNNQYWCYAPHGDSWYKEAYPLFAFLSFTEGNWCSDRSKNTTGSY